MKKIILVSLIATMFFANTAFAGPSQTIDSTSNSERLVLAQATDDLTTVQNDEGMANQAVGHKEVDYSNIGAQDNGGGLDDIDKESEAAYVLEFNPEEFKVGNPLTTRRHIQTLTNRLNGASEKAHLQNKKEILERIKIAKDNLKNLTKKLKKRSAKEELQALLDKCSREVFSIQESVAK